MKDKLGRSPDYADALMMRMYYELDKREPIDNKEEVKKVDPYNILSEEEEAVDFVFDHPY